MQAPLPTPPSKHRSPSPSSHRKPCTLCYTPRDVLVRCQTSPSSQWQFVCPGKCWRTLSGGVVDGDTNHSGYRYGGMWKNKHSGVSAKMPKKAKEKQKQQQQRQRPNKSASGTRDRDGNEGGEEE